MSAYRKGSIGFEATRVTRLVSLLLTGMIVLVLVAPPAGYLLVNLSFLRKEAHTHAATSAELLSRLIYGHGAMWRFEIHRLEEILTRTYTPGRSLYQRVYGLNGRTIIATGTPPAWPVLRSSAPVSESAWRVGTLEVGISLRPVLVRTGLVALASLLAALLTLIAARTLPLRVVRRAFRRLAESQAQLKLSQDALEQSHDRIIIMDRRGAIEYANAAPAGSGADAPPHTQERDLAGFLRGADGVEAEAVWAAIDRGETWSGRYSRSVSGAPRVDAEGTCSPIRDERGEVAHFILVEKDITEQLQLELRLREAQRMESLGTLAGGIAHDFNNILQPILGFVELLLLKTPRDSDPYETLQTIDRAARRAKDLVGRIMMFSRSTESELVPTHLGQVVEEAIGLLKATLPPDILCATRSEAALPPVLADPGQMHRMLLNLCINASQAMPDGGTLEVSLAAVHLERLACLHDRTLSGKYVRLVVADTGVGMDEATLSRMFEPFFTNRQKAHGTGLGLATVYGIVMNHNGGVRVTSSVGLGTRFEVYLPAAERPARGDADPAREAAPGLQGTILLVDDEPDVARLIEAFLVRMGYRVNGFVDPLKAYDGFRANPESYGLLITDRAMPGLSGEDLIARVRSIRADLPVIMCTGYVEPGAGVGAGSPDIDEMLLKPVSYDVLVGTVARVLARHASEPPGTLPS